MWVDFLLTKQLDAPKVPIYPENFTILTIVFLLE